jgi:hypothetical protein
VHRAVLAQRFRIVRQRTAPGRILNWSDLSSVSVEHENQDGSIMPVFAPQWINNSPPHLYEMNSYPDDG